MSTFKIGDQVQCIKNKGYSERYWLSEDVIHTVTDTPSSNSICLDGWANTRFTASRFVLIKEPIPYLPICRKIRLMERRFKERTHA